MQISNEFRLILDEYIGLTLDQAFAKADLSECEARVEVLDGVGQMLFDDYNPTRLNFTVENNIVVLVRLF